MKLYKLNSNSQVSVNIVPYLIDWNKEVSKPQKKVKDFLRPYLCGCIVLEELRIPGSLLRCDLVCVNKKWIFEVSPKSSHSFNPFFHKTRVGGFLKSVKSDIEKAEWAERNGFQLMVLDEDDIKILSKQFFLDRFGIQL